MRFEKTIDSSVYSWST